MHLRVYLNRFAVQPVDKAVAYVIQYSIARGGFMHTTIVYVHVKPGCADAFIEACRLNHEASIKEPGNRRFDVLQSVDDPNRFVLYEAYATAEDAAAHKKTKHYLTWRETVAEMMAEPRQGVTYNGLFPAE